MTGQPYSAEQITEHIQTLVDGTRITKTPDKTTLYRDSQGRTRIEQRMLPGPRAAAAGEPGLTFIEIDAPASGSRYTLDPRLHTARKTPIPRPLPLKNPANSLTDSVNGSNQPQQASSRGLLSPRDIEGVQRQRPQVSTESLGTQTIEGVLAEGSRGTVIYPVGYFGNDRPITAVSEAWFCPELKTMVLSKDPDPRSGESTIRVVNISRTEPDPSLFQVPSNYEVIVPKTTLR